MSYFKNTGTIEQLNAMLADFQPEPEKKKQASVFEINRHCAHCNKEVRVADAENPNKDGEYTRVICNRCYEAEMEHYNREEEWNDYLNKMQALRDIGVIVLEDYRED